MADELFAPQVEALLRRPEIKKPQEEFLLPSPPPEEPTTAVEGDTGLSPDIVADLRDEAALVDELLGWVLETTDEHSFPIPEEEQAELGSTVTTRDYLSSLGDCGGRGRRVRDRFERGLLTGCGVGYSWPLLIAPDLFDIREGLLAVAGAAEERLQRGAQGGESTFARAEEATRELTYSRAGQSLYHHAAYSKSYREKVARVVLSMRQELEEGVLRGLIAKSFRGGVESLREDLEKLLGILKLLRGLLCHAQLIWALRFFDARDALQSFLIDSLVRQAAFAMAEVLEKALAMMILPGIELFTGDLGDILGDRPGNYLGSVAHATLHSVIEQYHSVIDDILRGLAKESELRGDKLERLGERSTIGRWGAQIDLAVHLIESLLRSPSLTTAAIQRLAEEAARPLDAPASRLYDRLRENPRYRHLEDAPPTFGPSPLSTTA